MVECDLCCVAFLLSLSRSLSGWWHWNNCLKMKAAYGLAWQREKFGEEEMNATSQFWKNPAI